jgi:hypothetical protein
MGAGIAALFKIAQRTRGVSDRCRRRIGGNAGGPFHFRMVDWDRHPAPRQFGPRRARAAQQALPMAESARWSIHSNSEAQVRILSARATTILAHTV